MVRSAVVSSKATPAERQSATLQLLETTYDIILQLRSAWDAARRQDDRSALGDAVLRLVDPTIARAAHRTGFSETTQTAMLANVDAMREIADRSRIDPNTRTALERATDLLRVAYEEAAHRLVG